MPDGMRGNEGNGRPYFDVTRTEPLGDGLKRYLKKSGVGWMLNHADIVESWTQLVGEGIARQTRVRGFRAGTLHVDIFSPVLKAEIEQFQADSLVSILQEANPTLGIRRVRLHLAERPAYDEEEG